MAEIVIFCSSKKDYVGYPKHLAFVEQLMPEIARKGHRVNTGGSWGLMGDVTRIAKACGVPVRGIAIDTPEFPAVIDHCDEIERHAQLGPRQRRLIDVGDAFIALPGGFGTLHEAVHVAAERIVGDHQRRIVVIDRDFWRHQIAHLSMLRELGLLWANPEDIMSFADTVEEVMAVIDR